MLKRQKNKLAMYGAVLTYINDNQDVYSDHEEFVSHKTSLSRTIDDIRLKEDIRSKATKGKVKDKSVSRAAVTGQALAIAGALYAFGKKTGNQTLMAATKLSRSKLGALRDVELIIELNSIKDKANDNIAEMSKYGISQAKMEFFTNNIEQYSKAVGAKETGAAVKRGASKSVSTLFKDADSIIDSIDRFMENYHESNDEFYTGYKSARVIKDLGTKHAEGEEPEAPVQPPDENSNKAV